MSELRCLVCGSSQLDPLGYKCGRCGMAIGLRNEKCYVTEETKEKLLAHSSELSKFGIEIQQHESLQKSAGGDLAGVGIALQIVEAMRPGTLRDLVCFLRKLAVPEEEVLSLRLDEPEQILTYYRMDKKRNGEDL